MPHDLFEIYQSFEETYYLRLQGRRLSHPEDGANTFLHYADKMSDQTAAQSKRKYCA
jgi:hypothetical protein